MDLLDKDYKKYDNSISLAYDKMNDLYDQLSRLDYSKPQDAVKGKAIEDEIAYS